MLSIRMSRDMLICFAHLVKKILGNDQGDRCGDILEHTDQLIMVS